ncbi:hypothetical protein PFMALIP_05823, partial [Plasmodium falciparum MaliPS096_E11]
RINWKLAEKKKITKHSITTMKNYWNNSIANCLPQFIENYSRDVERLNEMKKQNKMKNIKKGKIKKNDKTKKTATPKVQFTKQRSNISMNRVIKGASLDYKKLSTNTFRNKQIVVNSILKKKKTMNKIIDKKNKLVSLKTKNVHLKKDIHKPNKTKLVQGLPKKDKKKDNTYTTK